MIRVFAIVMRWTVLAVAALLLAAVAGWAVLHWFIVPRIDDFRPRLTAWASQALGAPVTIGALTVQSNALLPAIAVQDVRVLGPDGQPALQVPHALVVFSVASLLRCSSSARSSLRISSSRPRIGKRVARGATTLAR